MTTSITNEYTSLQKYRSLTRKGDVLSCVRDEWRQGQTAILTQVLLLTIAALLSRLGWGCSTMGHSGPSPLQAGSHFGIPVTDWPTAAGTPVCIFSSTLLRLIYTGASLDWRLGRGSIYSKLSRNRKCICYNNAFSNFYDPRSLTKHQICIISEGIFYRMRILSHPGF